MLPTVEHLTVDQLLARAVALHTAVGNEPSAHGRMQFAYALREGAAGWVVRYVVSQGAQTPYGIWQVAVPPDGVLPSLSNHLPLLGWYEREMQDLYGLRFSGHPEPHPLVLHEGCPVDALPGREGFDRAAIPAPAQSVPPAEPQVVGAQIQRLPFGPVRADVVESAQFLFQYIGEGILHYQPRLFYKHRGMEARFEGRSPAHGAVLAERVSGTDSVAHALAFAQAVEQALMQPVPERARILRVVLAELERLYNHLHYFGYLAKTTTLKVGEAEGAWLSEQVKQINGRLTGSRFLRNLIVPGGLRRDLSVEGVSQALDALVPSIEQYLKRLANTRSYLDRLLTTGVLPRQATFDQGATGPIERASGLDRDLRRDHPYAFYEELAFAVPTAAAGDAHARAEVRAGEVLQSLDMLRQALAHLRPGAVFAAAPTVPYPSAPEGLGWVEGTRGGLLYAVHFDAEGKHLTRVKIKEPSFSNWRVFPFTVQDSNMMDYAINEASFGLSVAGADR